MVLVRELRNSLWWYLVIDSENNFSMYPSYVLAHRFKDMSEVELFLQQHKMLALWAITAGRKLEIISE